MADVDDTPVQTAEDAGPSEAVETPTTEETPDTDVALEDMELSLDDFDDDDDTEEPAEEPEEAAATNSTDEAKEEPDDGADETEQSDESTPTPTEEKPSAAEQKRINDAYAKQRIAEKKLREERETREQSDIQRYLQEAEDDADELALREQAVGKYQLQKERVALNSDKLQIGLDRAVADIDLFRSGSDEVKEALAEALDEFEDRFTVKDDKGNFLEVKGDVYQFLQTKAASIQKLTGVGARQEAQAKQNTKARTEPVPTRPPKEPKKDSDVSDFDGFFS